MNQSESRQEKNEYIHCTCTVHMTAYCAFNTIYFHSPSNEKSGLHTVPKIGFQKYHIDLERRIIWIYVSLGNFTKQIFVLTVRKKGIYIIWVWSHSFVFFFPFSLIFSKIESKNICFTMKWIDLLWKRNTIDSNCHQKFLPLLRIAKYMGKNHRPNKCYFFKNFSSSSLSLSFTI